MEFNYLKNTLVDLEYNEALDVVGGTEYAIISVLITIVTGAAILMGSGGDDDDGGGSGGGGGKPLEPPPAYLNSISINS